MVTGYTYTSGEQGFNLDLTRDEMELIQNALSVYLEHQKGNIEATAGKVLSRADVIGGLGETPETSDSEVTVPLDDLFIGTYIDAAELRAGLVTISGYDMTEEGT